MNINNLNFVKTIIFVVLFINPVVLFSQGNDLPFFDLTKDCNLVNILVQLQEYDFEEKKEAIVGNAIPSKCYTKSGQGMYVRFNCIYTPKYKRVASYWYRIYGGNYSNILVELKRCYGEPSSISKHGVKDSYEWHKENVDIKCYCDYDGWINFSYTEKTINRQLEKEIQRGLSSDELFVIILFICMTGVIIVYALYKVRKKKSAQTECNENKRKDEQHKIDYLNHIYKNKMAKKYGTPIRCINIQEDCKDGTIQHSDVLVFQKQKKIIIGRRDFDFGDILSCSMYDESQKGENVSMVTRTKTGNMLGRAALGALTFGVAGAVVGAVTATKTTESTTSNISHDGSYVVKIGVKSIERPSITLKLGNDKAKAEEIYALIQAIIAMK